MKGEPTLSIQLHLSVTVPVLRPEEISDDTRRQLVTALADLLLSAAMQGEAAMEGGSDEREDP